MILQHFLLRIVTYCHFRLVPNILVDILSTLKNISYEIVKIFCDELNLQSGIGRAGQLCIRRFWRSLSWSIAPKNTAQLKFFGWIGVRATLANLPLPCYRSRLLAKFSLVNARAFAPSTLFQKHSLHIGHILRKKNTHTPPLVKSWLTNCDLWYSIPEQIPDTPARTFLNIEHHYP